MNQYSLGSTAKQIEVRKALYLFAIFAIIIEKYYLKIVATNEHKKGMDNIPLITH